MKDYFAEMPQQYIICPKENGDQPLAQSQQTNSPVPSNPPSIPTTPEDASLRDCWISQKKQSAASQSMPNAKSMRKQNENGSRMRCGPSYIR